MRRIGTLFAVVMLVLAFGGCKERAEDTPKVSADIQPSITTEKTTRNGLDCLAQTTALDMDGDGADEQVEAYFTREDIWFSGIEEFEVYDTCEVVIRKDDGQEYAVVWKYDNMIPALHFAAFDAQSGLVQFYLAGNGPSADPYTQVFSFDGTQIVENVDFPGYLEDYDGQSRLFSEVNVNSYFDLHDGLMPLPKGNIVGTEIRREFNLLLMASPGEEYTVVVVANAYGTADMAAYVDMDALEGKLVCVVPADTPLMVLDAEFMAIPWSENGELYHTPWLKVQTPEGAEGWFCPMYGD